MTEFEHIFKLLGDGTRLRILMLLEHDELCVCQIMAVIGISQPLVSRNLALLTRGGFLEDRREGKLVFYRANQHLDHIRKKVYDCVKEVLRGDDVVRKDRGILIECTEMQKRTGRCDMETVRDFLEAKRKAAARKGKSQ
ncbi:MAG: ArsR/SmtB family transcription factor [bacterium]